MSPFKTTVFAFLSAAVVFGQHETSFQDEFFYEDPANGTMSVPTLNIIGDRTFLDSISAAVLEQPLLKTLIGVGRKKINDATAVKNKVGGHLRKDAAAITASASNIMQTAKLSAPPHLAIPELSKFQDSADTIKARDAELTQKAIENQYTEFKELKAQLRKIRSPFDLRLKIDDALKKANLVFYPTRSSKEEKNILEKSIINAATRILEPHKFTTEYLDKQKKLKEQRQALKIKWREESLTELRNLMRQAQNKKL